MGLVRLLHAWAGAILSLLLVVLGASGSLLVLKDDYVRLTVPAARGEAARDAQSLGRAAEGAEAALGADWLRTIAFAKPGVGVHRAYLKDEGAAYLDTDGRPVTTWTGNARPEAWLFDLHHHLLAGETGEIVAGIAGLAGSLMVVTGLIVWAPAWRSFRGRVWPRDGRRREMIGSHRDLGVIFAVPVFLLCLTGGAIVFHEQTRAMVAPGHEEAPPPVAGSGDVDWVRALKAAQAAYPDAVIRMASWPAKPGAPAVIRMKQPAEWHPNGRTTLFVDPATSAIVGVRDSEAQPIGVRAQNAVYPLHAGMTGGLVYQTVVFVSGLALAGLGGVGLWAFVAGPTWRRRPANGARA